MPRHAPAVGQRASRHAVAPLAGALAACWLLILSGCGPGAVQLAVPSPAPEVAAACGDLIGALPDQVLDQDRRETRPASPLTTAYGDPPIEVTCGVAAPRGADPTECFEVNGVGWSAEKVENGYIFTTIGRKLYLELAVPSKYAPEANALTDVSAAVLAHNNLVKPCL